MLFLIGLGLSNERDLSLNALDALKSCDYIFLENYTGVFNNLKELENLLNKSVQVLARSQVEEEKEYLSLAKKHNVALLVQGDPLSATTHTSILLDCKKQNIPYKVINSSSIFTACARTGLFLYKFGKVASIPLPEEGFNPSSFYKVLVDNQSIGAHTLFLLDLKPDRNKYLTIPQALKTLKKLDSKKYINKVVGCARLGFKDELILYGSANKLANVDWGNPPYCLIVPSKLHFIEKEFLKTFELK